MPSKEDRIRTVEAKIKRASELETNYRFLVYGRGGVGKTRLCATAPDVLLIDVNDKGWSSTKRDLDPNTYPVEYWNELVDVYWYLQNGDHEYRSVAIDGLTAMQNLCMKFVLGDEASRDASKDPDMPSKQVWGKVGELMKTQITNFRNLPMNVIFTAMQRVRSSGEEDEETSVFIGPAVSPSIMTHLEAAVAFIGYLDQREVIVKKGETKKKVRRRILTLGPSTRYMTKDRDGQFESVIRDPDLSEMLAILNKEA